MIKLQQPLVRRQNKFRKTHSFYKFPKTQSHDKLQKTQSLQVPHDTITTSSQDRLLMNPFFSVSLLLSFHASSPSSLSPPVSYFPSLPSNVLPLSSLPVSLSSPSGGRSSKPAGIQESFCHIILDPLSPAALPPPPTIPSG